MLVGVVVNPTAGMGGSVGLKGTDGVADEARRRGARPVAPQRAVRAMTALYSAAPEAEIVTCGGGMGEDAARRVGSRIQAVLPVGTPTTADDTRRAVRRMGELGVDLILFVGGDGTAADVLAAVAAGTPVVGVPGGVKIQSGVFAVGPEAAGLLAARFLTDPATPVVVREVMDIDEDLLRRGVLAPSLLGHLDVPDGGALAQHPKRRGPGTAEVLGALGQTVADAIEPGEVVAVGPGATAGAVMTALGLPHTLLGFDLVRDGTLLAADVAEEDLLAHGDDLRVVLAPTGGQGALLGRGNQQLTPAVLDGVGPDGLLIVATRERLAALQGRPLLVDIDDAAVAARLAGVRPVLVESGHVVFYPVSPPDLGSARLAG
jgi:predicted polyphosphate/ATP-dependent NAD kinase